MSTGEPMPAFTHGLHTIRVAFPGFSDNRDDYRTVRAVSNPVTLTISAKEKTDSRTLQSKSVPRLRYEVVPKAAEIPLGSAIFVTAQLTNEGSVPLTVYWGDYAYDDQYVFQVTRPDGTEMKPPTAPGRPMLLTCD